MAHILDTLKQRGYIKQIVYEEDLYKLLQTQCVPFYIGYDATADSLHIGHFLTLKVMSLMQKAGHKPIVLLGGGTSMVGDPTERTDMRPMLDKKSIEHNCKCFAQQAKKFLDFDESKPNCAVIANNADWLLNLNYVDFLREVGVHFSVNKMLTAECFKTRLQKGLSFLEFNYMLMQGYDFLVLHQKYGVKLQMGGDDQWSNILAGADLIRRKCQADAFAVTLTLLAADSGAKMGKSMGNAVWLNAEKTSPYDFYQHWRNVGDSVVNEYLRLLTDLPLDEISALTQHMDERMNQAKEILAYELTKAVHGKQEADTARTQAQAAFAGDTENMPQVDIANVTGIIDILKAAGLVASNSEARRLIEGGGIKINDDVIDSISYVLSDDILKAKSFVLHKGKKVHIKVNIK